MDRKETPTPHFEATPWELAQAQRHAEQTNTTEPPKPSKVKRSLSWRLLQGIFTALLLWGSYFLSPLSKPSSIVIVGAQQLSQEAVLKDAGIPSQASIWEILSQHERISHQLERSTPKIAAASVTLSQWNQITITIRENPAVAYYQQEDTYMELLADGQSLALNQAPANPQVPLLVNFTEETRKQLAKQFDQVNADVIALISQVTDLQESDNPLKLILKMKDGMRVIGSLKDIGTKLNYYPGIISQLTQKTGTIDMEVGIFYTPDVTAQ